MPGGQSRWSAGKDLSWEPLRIERVCEVKYDHMQGDRFRHAAIFQRWRPDKPPADCGYDQLEVTTPYELEKVFGAAGSAVADALSSRRPCARRDRAAPAPASARSGTCCRLTRMRVHVRKRPRIASTSTSAGSRCARGVRVARLPALEAGERVVLAARAADFDQRMRRACGGVDGCTRGGSPGCFR